MPMAIDPGRPWAMDLGKALRGSERTAYLRTKLFSPSAQDAILEFGSNDGMKAQAITFLLSQGGAQPDTLHDLPGHARNPGKRIVHILGDRIETYDEVIDMMKVVQYPFDQDTVGAQQKRIELKLLGPAKQDR